MIFDRYFRKSSGKIAKERLKRVIISDRTDCYPDMFEQIRSDVINTISKYAVIDQKRLEIILERSDDNYPVIIANIPIKARMVNNAANY